MIKCICPWQADTAAVQELHSLLSDQGQDCLCLQRPCYNISWDLLLLSFRSGAFTVNLSGSTGKHPTLNTPCGYTKNHRAAIVQAIWSLNIFPKSSHSSQHTGIPMNAVLVMWSVTVLTMAMNFRSRIPCRLQWRWAWMWSSISSSNKGGKKR